ARVDRSGQRAVEGLRLPDRAHLPRGPPGAAGGGGAYRLSRAARGPVEDVLANRARGVLAGAADPRVAPGLGAASLNRGPRPADALPVEARDFVLVQGLRDTRATLERWNARPGPVLWSWLAGSLAVVAALLLAGWGVALLSSPDPSGLAVPGLNRPPSLQAVGSVLFRNSLVLALHAMACVAGFIAGSSLPLQATRYNGVWRRVHDRAGPLAIGFVVCATTFSLCTQAFVLGGAASTLAAQLHITPGLLLVGLLPHAVPELTALFLP